jgi:hypothetical protein
MQRPRRGDRRARPTPDCLEDRTLLDARTQLVNGVEINDKDLRRLVTQLTNVYPGDGRIPVSDRRISYKTPTGQTAVVTLYGQGSLKGTTVNGGVLDLVYNLTDSSSRIVGRVVGGGRAPLAGIRDADSAPRSPSSSGVEPLNAVVLHSFRLVDGGYVNLTGGVLQLNLYSVGRDTEIHLTEGEVPETETQTTSVIVSGAPTVGGISAPVAQETTTVSTGVTGVDIQITRVDAAPLGTPPLGAPAIFAVDPATSQLIRFDLNTGNPNLAIPLSGLSTADASVGLGRVDAGQLVLVGDGQTILAFDAVTGAARGQFTVANLAALGFGEVDGIGSSADRTLLVDSGGEAVWIDVRASLAQGQAVARGNPFIPQQELTLTGGATGLPGSDTLYVVGAAHFDTFQPNLNQFGVVALSPTAGGFSEASRTAIPASTSGGTINAGPSGMLLPDPSDGFGAIDDSLARITGLSAGKNVITLYDPSTLAIQGTAALNYPNPLSGLSESFYPGIRGSALIDVEGTLARFLGTRVQGLVLNGQGTVNNVTIQRATDTVVIGRPLDHVNIGVRDNVQLLSNARGTNGEVTRGGVTIDPTLPSQGPVSVP